VFVQEYWLLLVFKNEHKHHSRMKYRMFKKEVTLSFSAPLKSQKMTAAAVGDSDKE
jgi:hypothetical protein